MTKKALDEKYSYQIDEHDVVHLFRGEENCQQHLTNPLLSAIFKIEQLEKENAELKEQHKNVCENLTNTHRNIREQLTKAKEIIKTFLGFEEEFF